MKNVSPLFAWCLLASLFLACGADVSAADECLGVANDLCARQTTCRNDASATCAADATSACYAMPTATLDHDALQACRAALAGGTCEVPAECEPVLDGIRGAAGSPSSISISFGAGGGTQVGVDQAACSSLVECGILPSSASCSPFTTGGSCATCVDEDEICETIESSCGDVCAEAISLAKMSGNGGSSDAGGSGGGPVVASSCTELAECCANATPANRTSCQTAQKEAGSNEALCASILANIEKSYCPGD